MPPSPPKQSLKNALKKCIHSKDASSPIEHKKKASKNIVDSPYQVSIPQFVIPSFTLNTLLVRATSSGLGNVEGLASETLSNLAATFQFDILPQEPTFMSKFLVFDNLVGGGELSVDVIATLSFDFAIEEAAISGGGHPFG